MDDTPLRKRVRVVSCQDFEEKFECQVPPGCRNAWPDGPCCGLKMLVPLEGPHELNVSEVPE